MKIHHITYLGEAPIKLRIVSNQSTDLMIRSQDHANNFGWIMQHVMDGNTWEYMLPQKKVYSFLSYTSIAFRNYFPYMYITFK